MPSRMRRSADGETAISVSIASAGGYCRRPRRDRADPIAEGVETLNPDAALMISRIVATRRSKRAMLVHSPAWAVRSALVRWLRCLTSGVLLSSMRRRRVEASRISADNSANAGVRVGEGARSCAGCRTRQRYGLAATSRCGPEEHGFADRMGDEHRHGDPSNALFGRICS